jgi:hypothetical protein
MFSDSDAPKVHNSKARDNVPGFNNDEKTHSPERALLNPTHTVHHSQYYTIPNIFDSHPEK